ncbi:MAG: sigma-70 family RNA polymerase sigma factor [Acidobacteriota bacterium]|nr:sigma-70 family RNA polymerase sigma factor [Acidobacteriota bacterium]
MNPTIIPTISVEEFEAAAMPHVNDLYRTARRVIGNVTEAEDIVQETMLQAWKSFHRFEAGTNCRAWLFKILFHVVSHHRRKWFRLKQNSEQEEEMMMKVAAEAEIPQRLSDEDVLAAFDKLPEHYRAVILLADVQEFSYREVAQIAGIPIGTVMSRLNRGRKLLQGELVDFAAGYGIKVAQSVNRPVAAIS